MKILFSILWLVLTTNPLFSQVGEKDSLLYRIKIETVDTTKVHHLLALSRVYQGQLQQDSALLFAYQGLELSQAIGYKSGEIECDLQLARISWNLGDYSTSIKFSYAIYNYGKSIQDTLLWINGLALLSNSFRDQGDFREALKMSKENLPLVIASENCNQCGVANAAVGAIYFGLEQYDSALFYIQKGLTYPVDFAYGWELMMAGRIYAKLNNEKMAFRYLHQSIQPLIDRPNLKDLNSTYVYLSELYTKTGQYDSAIFYGKLAKNIGKTNGFNKELLDSYLALSHAYENVDKAEALDNLKLAMELKNNIYSQDKQRQITSLKFNEIIKQNEIQSAERDAGNRLKLNALLGSTFTLVIVAFLLFRNSRMKQKAKQDIESAFNRLKDTQTQLIQSEKMASLGELTAGIAHEIQNPLNFVNNFSEVSSELLDEMKIEQAAGNWSLATEIADEVKSNLEKVVHHGKRADAIVKGMLQHSRSSSGQKELTDINALCDEYLRLSYHGYRAKDKSFNSKFEADFEPSLPKINVIPQDIGRVVLNLINNAFYAVTLRHSKGDYSYQPTVWVSTQKLNDKILISVKDNGPGIPDSIKEKIFQPFFTTKPTGQGTGLGLSLSYDIVKAHRGKFEVESTEGEGTEFTIQLPMV